LFRSISSILVAAVFAIIIISTSVSAQDKPTIIKDWVQVDASTISSYKGSYDTWSWVPMISFRVNGPIESGGQLAVEFAYPGNPKWVSFNCDTKQIAKGFWWKTSCGGQQIPDDKGITYTGPVTFTIKLHNELAGSDATIFTGTAKITKVKSNEYGPKAANHLVYVVDKDWNMPIGYVWVTPGDVYGWKLTNLNVGFWVRGEAVRFDPHVFYNGKEIGKVFMDGGTEVGTPGCDTDVDSITTKFVQDDVPQKGKWARVVCKFYNVYGLDDSGQKEGMFGPKFEMRKNPGEYEVKILWNGKLARSIKFTVKPDGSFDNGMAKSNSVGTDRVIVPVQVIGDQDGTWDRNSWKTDAFWGNPLNGFSALP
jgi:hypothetical protein